MYGNQIDGTPITEDLPLFPQDYYSESKVISENILKESCKKNSIPFCSLRLTGVYGEGDSNKSTIFQLNHAAEKSNEIKIFDGGETTRDFFYVEDLYKIILSIHQNPLNHTFNIATGASHSILSIAKFLQSRFYPTAKITHKKAESSFSRAKKMVYDINKLNFSFPTITITPLWEGIKKYQLNKKIKKSYKEILHDSNKN